MRTEIWTMSYGGCRVQRKQKAHTIKGRDWGSGYGLLTSFGDPWQRHCRQSVFARRALPFSRKVRSRRKRSQRDWAGEGNVWVRLRALLWSVRGCLRKIAAHSASLSRKPKKHR